MRIAICTDIYLPQLSGISDSIEILAGELRRRGHTVRIYAPRMAGVGNEPDIMRFPSVMIPGSAGGLILVMPFGAMKDLRRFKPEIIHTHTFSTVGFVALYASLSLKVPLVGTDHTFPVDYLHYLKLNFGPFPFLVRKFAAWYYNRCRFVTAPSKNMLDELMTYKMTKPSQVVSNHVPSHLFRSHEEKDQLKKKFGIGEKAVLIFGRIAVEKNLEMALEIFADVAERSEAELVFLGDGPYRETIQNLVGKKQLEKRVHFLGTLRGEKLVEAINACEVFLITSRSETQSMTTIQALACNLPVVAVRAGGLPEYVEDGKTGYVIDPDNKKLFADRIIGLLEDKELRKRMGEAGRESIMRFSPEAITNQFEKIYNKVI